MNNANALVFIGKFLSWYQDSFSTSDVVSRIKLEELVQEAESIHVEKVKELEKQLQLKQVKSVIKSKAKRKRISRYL